MISFSIDRHTTISDICDGFSGYYSYAPSSCFSSRAPSIKRARNKALKSEAVYHHYNQSEDFRRAPSPLEVSGLGCYGEDD